jgi:multiple sugar transport system substrate-binding protein
VQLALTNVVVQSIPDLSAGKVDDGKLTGLLGQAQSAAQGALDKAK